MQLVIADYIFVSYAHKCRRQISIMVDALQQKKKYIFAYLMFIPRVYYAYSLPHNWMSSSLHSSTSIHLNGWVDFIWNLKQQNLLMQTRQSINYFIIQCHVYQLFKWYASMLCIRRRVVLPAELSAIAKNIEKYLKKWYNSRDMARDDLLPSTSSQILQKKKHCKSSTCFI